MISFLQQNTFVPNTFQQPITQSLPKVLTTELCCTGEKAAAHEVWGGISDPATTVSYWKRARNAPVRTGSSQCQWLTQQAITRHWAGCLLHLGLLSVPSCETAISTVYKLFLCDILLVFWVEQSQEHFRQTGTYYLTQEACVVSPARYADAVGSYAWFWLLLCVPIIVSCSCASVGFFRLRATKSWKWIQFNPLEFN